MKNKDHPRVPSHVEAAVVSLLSQYYPGLTLDQLEQCLINKSEDKPSSEDYLLTVKEVAERLHVSRTRCFQLMKERILPRIHLGGPRTVRIPSSAVDRLIRKSGRLKNGK